MKFDIVEFDGNQSTLDKIRSYKKWKTSFLDTVSKEYIFRELSFQLKSNPEARVFCIISYMTAGRRNEVLTLRRQDFTRERININNRTYEVLLISMLNQKNRENDRKYIPLVKGLSELEDQMISEIEDYISDKNGFIFRQMDSTTWNRVLENVFFETRYKERWMPITQTLIVKFSLFPHYLRHCRLTHMNWLSPILITQLAGWSNNQLQGRFGASGKLIDTYIRRNWETLAREMIIHGLE